MRAIGISARCSSAESRHRELTQAGVPHTARVWCHAAPPGWNPIDAALSLLLYGAYRHLVRGALAVMASRRCRRRPIRICMRCARSPEGEPPADADELGATRYDEGISMKRLAFPMTAALLLSLMSIVPTALAADSASIDFDRGYDAGTINGQDGWSGLAAAAVQRSRSTRRVEAGFRASPAAFDTKSFRMSNACHDRVLRRSGLLAARCPSGPVRRAPPAMALWTWRDPARRTSLARVAVRVGHGRRRSPASASSSAPIAVTAHA